jgi:hypothetical protein
VLLRVGLLLCRAVLVPLLLWHAVLLLLVLLWHAVLGCMVCRVPLLSLLLCMNRVCPVGIC